MKKQRGKMRKQIMAVVLSVAMMVSNLSVAAAEPVEVVETETVTVVEETSSAVETSSVVESSSTVVIEDQEVATTAQTPLETSTSEESTTKATEEVADEGASKEENSSEEISSEEDATAVETTEVESSEEETTEEVALLATADNEVAQDITVTTADEFVEAINAIQPGYAIKVKAGTYKFSKSILIEESNAGAKDAMKEVIADGGEVVFDFSAMGYSGSDADKSNRGIILDGSYWHFYGIKIKNAADNGMLLSGDNNLIEMCVFEGNHDTGLQVSRYQTGYDQISQWPSNNTIKNCTSFNNVDSEGENADGFAAKLTCGEGNVFDGCMAYNNSDDGWDLYAKTATGPIGVVTLKNCIAFRNGKLTDGSGSAEGDMNGFKLGGSGVGTPHVIVNCIAFENGAHGFTDNNNPTAVSLTNCTSFNNSRYESKKSNFQMNRENGGINSNLLSFTTDSMGSDAFIGTINNSVYYNNKPAYYSVAEKKLLGNNKFYVTFIPDADYVPGEYQKLSSYATVKFTHEVLFKSYGKPGDSLYVAPKGTATGNGTKANPLDIYTAVKYVQAGQTIVLMEGTYNLTNTIKVERGIDGTADNMIYMVADPEASTRPVFDFGGRCAGMVLAGDYWYFKGFDVTKSADGQKGMQVSGNYNVVDQVNAYMNGNTGIQISRYLGTDEYEDWPSYNTILNCTSYLNADKGYEDADGFAAKLTVGDGNVFDGCIAHHNADDGWDLFAKVQSGCIGAVTIQNSVAYKNGYVLTVDGQRFSELSFDGIETNAGNGNGFKMGGDSMSGHHVIKNSIAFLNKAKGIDSNSCPDIEAYDCVSFDNESYNVAFYTNTAANTAYIADGVISYRKNVGMDVAESMKLLGTQDKSKVENAENFYWDVASKTSKNTEGVTVADNWFESLEFTTIDRNADGTINTHGFLVLTEEAKTGSSIGGTGSGDVEIGDETDGKVESGVVVTPSKPAESNKEESSSSSSSSKPVTTVKPVVTIPEMETPLAPMPGFGNMFATTVKLTKEAKLQAELLQKYHGKNVYLMTHLGNGVGFTVNAAGVNAQVADLKLETKIEKVEKFAEGFDTVKLTASSEAKLSFNIGVHTNVGAEYAGKTAYLFRKSLVTGQYELAKVMVVNEIGNVALETNEVSDIMILIAK